MKTQNLNIGLILFTCFLLSGCSARRGEPFKGAMSIGDESVNRGKLVFMKYCNRCHPGGEQGVGLSLNNRPMPGIYMRTQVRFGFGPMPAFNKKVISHGQMKDLIHYLKALRRQ